MKKFFGKLTAGDVGGFTFFAVVLPGLVIYLTYLSSSNRTLTALESGLLQTLSILATSASAYYASKITAQRIAQARAKLALRRIFTLYTFFPRFIESIEKRRKFLESVKSDNATVEINYVFQALDSLSAQAYEQIGTVNDAVEDWKDMVPKPEGILEKYKGGRNE